MKGSKNRTTGHTTGHMTGPQKTEGNFPKYRRIEEPTNINWSGGTVVFGKYLTYGKGSATTSPHLFTICEPIFPQKYRTDRTNRTNGTERRTT